MQLLLLSLLLPSADVSLASAPTPRDDGAVACGSRPHRALRDAVAAYCRDEADPSERLGCRVVRYAFTHCDALPELTADEEGSLRGGWRASPTSTTTA